MLQGSSQARKAKAGREQELRGELRCPGLATRGSQEPRDLQRVSLSSPSQRHVLDVGRRANPGATCDFTEQICGGKLLCTRAGPITQLRAIAAWLSVDGRPCPPPSDANRRAETASRAGNAFLLVLGAFPSCRVQGGEPPHRRTDLAAASAHGLCPQDTTHLPWLCAEPGAASRAAGECC